MTENSNFEQTPTDVLQEDTKLQISDLLNKSDLSDEDFGLLNLIRDMSSTTQSASNEIAHRVVEVAEFAGGFDYIMVTGGSRSIARSLLQAAGVTPDKFISLDVAANIRAYKKIDDQSRNLTDVERAEGIRKVIYEKGISPESKISLCVVDERIESGRKANAILRALSHIPELANYAFATFSATGFTEKGTKGTTTPLDDRWEEVFDTPELAKRVYIPPSANTSTTYVDYMLDDLATLAPMRYSAFSRAGFTPEVIRLAKQVSRDMLKRLYHAVRDELSQ